MFERRGHTRKQRTIFGVHQQHSKNRGSREKHAWQSQQSEKWYSKTLVPLRRCSNFHLVHISLFLLPRYRSKGLEQLPVWKTRFTCFVKCVHKQVSFLTSFSKRQEFERREEREWHFCHLAFSHCARMWKVSFLLSFDKSEKPIHFFKLNYLRIKVSTAVTRVDHLA